jgi:ATP-dependent exoDNAse (exonuclease V) alpha subunit
MILNDKQQYAYDSIKAGRNFFLTGPGGVGKSVLVNKIREEFSDDTIFLSPTGIAAVNIGGSTIHRTFKFHLGYLSDSKKRTVHPKVRELFAESNVKRIVIDEISMVRADLFEAIDRQLKIVMKSRRAFGGLQIIVVGDFFQLPPVLNYNSPEGQLFNQEYKSPYAFDTDSWDNAGFETIELTQIMRQSDETFINALNAIRKKTDSAKTSLDLLNRIGSENDANEESVMLCSTNKDADVVNEHKYNELDGKERLYVGDITGDFKDFPVQQYLRLKIGCRVLITVNSETYCNGDSGTVIEMSDELVVVQSDRGQRFHIEKAEWKQKEYDVVDGELTEQDVGTFKQFPLKLAYAITIHKSQGMSLSNAAIYTGRGCFSHGQLYVALSRLRSLEGMSILRPLGYNEIIVDQRVIDFYDRNVKVNLFG